MRELSQVRVKVQEQFENICPFPIGYIYMSSNSTSPADIYGGNWTQLTDNRFLRPSTTWNSTGGSSTHQHWTTLGCNYDEDTYYFGNWSNVGGQGNTRTKNGQHYQLHVDGSGGAFFPFNGLFRETASYSASTLPIYRDVYCWYRVS